MADRAVVWLGPANTSSGLAMKAPNDMGAAIEVNWKIYDMTLTSRDESKTYWADENTPLPFDTQTWTAVSDFLSRSWFERLWTWIQQ